jgi:hypothetical protein
VVEAVHQRVEGRDRLWSRLGWSACVPIGTGLYLGYWWVRAGNWSIPLEQQALWGRSPSPPWIGLIQGVQKAFVYPGLFPSGDLVIDLLIVLFALIAAVFVARWFRASYTVWTWGSLLLTLTYATDFAFNGRPLASIPRYVLPLFPIFWVASLLTERRISHEAIVIGSSIGLAVCTILYVNWGMA